MANKNLKDAEQLVQDLQREYDDLTDHFRTVPNQIADAQKRMEQAFKESKPSGKIEKEILELIQSRDSVPPALEELQFDIETAKQEVMKLRKSADLQSQSKKMESIDAQALELVNLMHRLRQGFLSQQESNLASNKYQSFPRFTETIDAALESIKANYPELLKKNS
jgi:predicted  nucleic acid-binding Zn-ribbon protein